MPAKTIRRQPGESHADLWSLYKRFGNFKGSPTDYHGHRFGRWTVVGLEGWGKGGAHWLARCECGTEKVMRLGNMLKGISRSCGCYSAEVHLKHGMHDTRPYRIWGGMIGRCRNPNDPNFPKYGGRGIEVCERWTDFEGFWLDMKRTYSDGLTLERIDVNGPYAPENCCWIPKPEQMQNLRRTVRIATPKGEMTLRQASRAFGIKRDTLRSRIRYGWPASRLLEGYC